MRSEQITIRREGTHILLLKNGVLFADMPWDKAEQVARAIMSKARSAEEEAKADAIARDHAILLRAGVPLGLTNEPRIRSMARTLAAWSSELRRYMPGGIKSREEFGVPAIIQQPPKGA